jgi:hypothetical protein
MNLGLVSRGGDTSVSVQPEAAVACVVGLSSWTGASLLKSPS